MHADPSVAARCPLYCCHGSPVASSFRYLLSVEVFWFTAIVVLGLGCAVQDFHVCIAVALNIVRSLRRRWQNGLQQHHVRQIVLPGEEKDRGGT